MPRAERRQAAALQTLACRAGLSRQNFCGAVESFTAIPGIQYITKSLYFMIPAPQPCLLPRILSLFAAIQCKCQSINHLHKQMNLSSRA